MAKKRRKVRKKQSSGGGWRRSPITAGVAILVILGCLYTTFFSGSGYSVGDLRADYVCTSCREVFRESMKMESPPFECFQCEAKAMWMANKCMDCSHINPDKSALVDYTCSKCDHNLMAIMKDAPPHVCPNCSEKSLWESLYCADCDVIFPSIDFNNVCPDCKNINTFPASDQIQACEECSSENLGSVTPYSVIKWELGRDLTPREEKEVDEWRENND